MFAVAKPFLLSLALGLLLGIERERSFAADGRPAPFGARTFALLAMLGAIAAHLWSPAGTISFAIALFVAALIVAAYARPSGRAHDAGTTTEVAAMIAFGLGWLSHGEARLAAMLGVIVLAVLWLKPKIHAFAHAGLTDAEVRAALLFLVIALVVLPLLPDRTVDPWGIVNPSKLWLLFTLIAGLGFAGYIAVRALGPARGLAAAGFFAGLVSSTAATLSLSRHAHEEEKILSSLTLGIVLANVASASSTIVVAGMANRALLLPAGILLGSAIVVGVVGAAFAYWHARTRGDRPTVDFTLSNPLELKPALAMAAMFGGILVLAAIAQRWLGPSGAIATAGIAGSTDVQGATLAAGTLAAAGSITPTQALEAILAAYVANMIVKITIVGIVGGRRIFVAATPVLVMMALAAGGGFVLAQRFAANPIPGAAP